MSPTMNISLSIGCCFFLIYILHNFVPVINSLGLFLYIIYALVYYNMEMYKCKK